MVRESNIPLSPPAPHTTPSHHHPLNLPTRTPLTPTHTHPSHTLTPTHTHSHPSHLPTHTPSHLPTHTPHTHSHPSHTLTPSPTHTHSHPSYTHPHTHSHTHTHTPSQLYPYHLQDKMIEGLRVTPFLYYSNMMQDIMTSERSYDSLPNFTAADCKGTTPVCNIYTSLKTRPCYENTSNKSYLLTDCFLASLT